MAEVGECEKKKDEKIQYVAPDTGQWAEVSPLEFMRKYSRGGKAPCEDRQIAMGVMSVCKTCAERVQEILKITENGRHPEELPYFAPIAPKQ